MAATAVTITVGMVAGATVATAVAAIGAVAVGSRGLLGARFSAEHSRLRMRMATINARAGTSSRGVLAIRIMTDSSACDLRAASRSANGAFLDKKGVLGMSVINFQERAERERQRKKKEFFLANGFEIVAGNVMFRLLSAAEIEEYILAKATRRYDEIAAEDAAEYGTEAVPYEIGDTPEDREAYIREYTEEEREGLKQVAQESEMTFEECVSSLAESDRHFPTEDARKRCVEFFKKFAR